MTDIRHDDPTERSRAQKRAWIAKKRATMTPEERAEARRDADARYREAHREQRRAADRARRDRA